MLYTSYFANRNIPEDYVKVAICRYPPAWYHGLCYSVLAPSKEILSAYKKSGDIGSFTEAFNSYLSSLDIQRIVQDLLLITNRNENIVLLCFEGRGKFCHRNLVREYFKKFGIACEEM